MKTCIKMIALLWVLFSIDSAYAQLISNGNFDQGINDVWKHRVQNGSANFYDEKNAVNIKDGVTSLRVEASQANGQLDAITSTNSSFTKANESKFLMRFWAKSTKEFSELTVTLGEGAGRKSVHFKLRSFWHLYHVPFDVANNNLPLTFHYQTADSYFIDGVEILDQMNKSIDVENTFIWNEKYAPGFGWIAGDNDVSLTLPDGRTAWFFNDSFYGINKPDDNVFNSNGQRFLRNAMVVQEKDGLLHSRFTGEQSNTTRYFETNSPTTSPPDDNFYWLGDAILNDGKILVYLIEVYDAGGGFAHGAGKSFIAQYSYPELELESIKQQESFALGYEKFFVDGEYIYLFRTESEGVWGRYTHVARSARDDILGKKGTWRYFDGLNWVKDIKSSKRVIDQTASSFVKLQEGNYASIALPSYSGKVQVSFAQKPEGPWTKPHVFYQIPAEQNYYHYMTNVHAQLANGNYSVSYSVNGENEGWGTLWNDKYWYRQRYIQADLRGLSPYTTKFENVALNKPVYSSSTSENYLAHNAVDGRADTRWSSAYNDNEWLYVDLGARHHIDGVKIAWQFARASDYEIQISNTGQSWQTIKTVIQNIYEVNDYSGLNVKARYVRILGKKRVTMWGFSVNELSIYGSTTIVDEDITDNGGTISSQYADTSANESVSKIIDNLIDTKFFTDHTSTWIEYRSKKQYVVTGYALTSANDAPMRDPSSWSLQGNVNGSWIDIDKQTNNTFTGLQQSLSFDAANEKAYKHFRFNLQHGNAGEGLQLANASIFGYACHSPTIKPYQSINGQLWHESSETKLNEGGRVNLGPVTDLNGKWSWVGPNGFVATTREISLTNIELKQAGNYVVTFTGDDGCAVQYVYYVDVLPVAGKAHACLPADIVITPNQSINGELWHVAAETKPEQGLRVMLGPVANLNGTWEWTGKDGLISKSRELIFEKISESDSGKYAVTFTSSLGCKKQFTYNVNVVDANSILLEAENYSLMAGVTVNTASTGEKYIGSLDIGDWVAYQKVNFKTAGTYKVEYSAASPSNVGILKLDLNGNTYILGRKGILNTEGWEKWRTVSQFVEIPKAGVYDVGITSEYFGWNLNWIRFTKTE